MKLSFFKKNELKNKFDFYFTLILFLFPLLAGLILFQYLPLISAMKNSFFQLSLLNPNKSTFVGFENYLRMINDPKFIISIKNSLIYAFGKIIIQIPLSLLFAVLLNRAIKGIGLVRSAIFAPTITTGAVVAVIWNLMYHPTNGFLNSLLMGLGIPRQPFLTDITQALPSILGMGIWQDVGFTMLLFLAGLQGIPEIYYEAAKIDGANNLQLIKNITLPLLKRTILLTVIISTIFSFKVFTPIYVMTKGGPRNSTLLTVYYIYEQGFKFMDIGYASAMAIILMAIMVIITLIQNGFLKTNFEY